jgi:hypothetical protein
MFNLFLISHSIFSGLGNILSSRIEFKGIAGKFSEPITDTGLSKKLKQF